jgi:hypothetical protein
MIEKLTMGQKLLSLDQTQETLLIAYAEALPNSFLLMDP